MTLVLVTAASIGDHVAAQTSSQAPLPIPEPPLVVNSAALTEDERARFLSKLGEIMDSRFVLWPTVKVASGKSMLELIDDQYGYDDGTHPRTARAIAHLIKTANGIDDINRLQAGRRLFVPPLPVKPFSHSLTSVSQVVPVSTSVTPRRFAGTFTPFGIREDPSIPIGSGKLWVLEVYGRYRAMLLSTLPDSAISRATYAGFSHEEAEVQFSVPTRISTDPRRVPGTPTVDFRGIDARNAPQYYIVDFFERSASRPCPHGRGVLDVALLVLERHGASHLADAIKPIEADPRVDRARSEQLVRNYLSVLLPDSDLRRKTLEQTLQRLRAARDEGMPLRVPLIYLQALYHDLVTRADTAVISSSFWVRFDGSSFLPPSYTRASDSILLSAVPNHDSYPVEDVRFEQPIRQFFDYRADYSVGLVGALRTPGVTLGMTSKIGDGITFVGQATGWGGRDTCIAVDEAGTSYATPDVATQLFLARTYWQHRGRSVKARDAKIRMLLTSLVDPRVAGKYAAAGTTALDRLLGTDDAFVITTAGALVNVRQAAGELEYVERLRNNLPETTTVKFRRGHGGAFSGLHVTNGGTFIFQDDRLMWQQAEIVRFQLTVNVDGSEENFPSVAEFSRRYSALVTLD